MFYCKYCSDTLEIIKNTNLANESAIKQIESVDELVEIFFSDMESKKNKFINSDTQYSIMWPESEIDNLDLKQIIKKNEVIGMGPEELKTSLSNMYRQIVKFQKSVSNFYLSCTNCSTTYFLEPGTVIDSINFEKSAASNDDDSKIRSNDPTLPRTKDFICPNSKCITNAKSDDINVLVNKEAVFYRSGKEYNIKYICCQCNTQWGT
jgi:hypothetical protein